LGFTYNFCLPWSYILKQYTSQNTVQHAAMLAMLQHGSKQYGRQYIYSVIQTIGIFPLVIFIT